MIGMFLTILVFSFAIALIMHYAFPNRFSMTEMGILFSGAVIVGILALAITSYVSMHDINIVNGQVTSKNMQRVSCSHSYQCRCRTVTTGKVTSTTCDTCYMHAFDQDWLVHTTVGTIDIDRVDSQGLIPPTRWKAAHINETVSLSKHTRNYVLASPNSLFSMQMTDNDATHYGKWLPDYPKVYDYYRFNHALNLGINGVNLKSYNDLLANNLRTLGPAKEANILLVFVPTSDRSFLEALERHWIGGKKNDIVVVIGSTHYPDIEWAGAFTFGRSLHNQSVVVHMRNNIEELASMDNPDSVVNTIASTIKTYYHRAPMKTFEYLKHDYVPSGKLLIVVALCYIVLLIVALIVFWKNDF